jgi:hypothetical protein
MSVVHNGGSEKAVEQNWTSGLTYHLPMKHMSLCRFEQIKRYLHISPPETPPLTSIRPPANPVSHPGPSTHPAPPPVTPKPSRQCKRKSAQAEPILMVYGKLEPLATQVATASKVYLLPATELSLDEMIVKFKGRSKDTNTFKHKPIKKRYKIFALCVTRGVISIGINNKIK